MRPAHQAREVQQAAFLRPLALRRFNEARASSTGSNVVLHWIISCVSGFNEARASSTGSNASEEHREPATQASMRPAHQAREVILCVAEVLDAH